ncbi:MAG: hypothetical protein ACR2PL_08655, partial [Dehalococcoidia bacterium]
SLLLRGAICYPKSRTRAKGNDFTMLIIGRFTHSDDVEIALNNLVEADYDAASISLVALDSNRVASLSTVPGPVSGLSPRQFVSRLAKLGLPDIICKEYADGLARDAICLALVAPEGAEGAAREILTDQKADLVSVLNKTSFAT